MLPNEVISVSEFIDLFNQTLEYAYPAVVIEGELANFRISKNKWIYFDLKDDNSTLKFFGTVYALHSPLENGMILKVGCYPKMHHNYGLSMQVQSLEPTGEGSIKRSALLLEQKLRLEGLFAEEKKRLVPYPPSRIGLITSAQSAAYADFIKILNTRWRGVEITLMDVQVQGQAAIGEIIPAIEYFNRNAEDFDALIIIRGGGSPEDLAVFSSESVTRAVAASLVPTLVAIGHEIDISLAELAADKRASTPSNAAELLVPDKKHYLAQLQSIKEQLRQSALDVLGAYKEQLRQQSCDLMLLVNSQLSNRQERLSVQGQLLAAYNPAAVLARGYAIIRKSNIVVYGSKQLKLGDKLSAQFSEGEAAVIVEKVT